ncbi:MAG: sensor histidine kinase, partial [Coprococcus sp.]
MNSWGLFFCVMCIIVAVIIVLWNQRKTRKTIDTIKEMLDSAMNGTFTENTFDESKLSSLETKFAHYISASEVSARNVAVEKDKIKSLIADISHQTKTPIANLLLYSELLKEENLPESAQASVEILYMQSEKLRFLIDSLVKLSRLENGIIALSSKQEGIQPMLQNLVNQYASKAADKGLFLNLNDTDAIAYFDVKWTEEALG